MLDSNQPGIVWLACMMLRRQSVTSPKNNKERCTKLQGTHEDQGTCTGDTWTSIDESTKTEGAIHASIQSKPTGG